MTHGAGSRVRTMASTSHTWTHRLFALRTRLPVGLTRTPSGRTANGPSRLWPATQRVYHQADPIANGDNSPNVVGEKQRWSPQIWPESIGSTLVGVMIRGVPMVK